MKIDDSNSRNNFKKRKHPMDGVLYCFTRRIAKMKLYLNIIVTGNEILQLGNSVRFS